jgi:putative FmdB family regulatory protein
MAMPIYEYGCPTCKGQFDRLRPLARADEAAACPRCGAIAYRMISLVAPAPRGGTATLEATSAGGCCGGGGCACGR